MIFVEILKAELKAYDETRQEREKLIKSLSDTYNLKMGDLRSEDLTDEKIGLLVSDLKGIVEREEEKIESLTVRNIFCLNRIMQSKIF